MLILVVTEAKQNTMSTWKLSLRDWPTTATQIYSKKKKNLKCHTYTCFQMEGSMLPRYWRWTMRVWWVTYCTSHATILNEFSGGFLFYNHLKMQKVRDYIFWHIIYACKEPTLLGSILWKHLEQTGASLFSKSSTSLDSRDSYNYHRNYCFVTIM